MTYLSHTFVTILLTASFVVGNPAAAAPGDDYSDLLHVLPAVHDAAAGTITTWSNPDTGHWGLVEMKPAANRDTDVKGCKPYIRRTFKPSLMFILEGRACRNDHLWRPTGERLAMRLTKSGSRLVAATQILLRELNYGPGAIDGLFGTATRRAIKRFQKERGLPDTGRPSSVLVHHLWAATKYRVQQVRLAKLQKVADITLQSPPAPELSLQVGRVLREYREVKSAALRQKTLN